MDFEDDDRVDADIPRLLEEIPLLYRVRAFADGLNAHSWFSRLGEHLDEREKHLARLYLDGLGFPDADPALVESWEEAGYAAENPEMNSQAWEAEEMLRSGLVGRALERLDESAVQTALTYVAQATADNAREAMEDAAHIADLEDEALIQAGAGALVQAANGAALVVLAEAEDDDDPHPFVARWRLFARGRWPIGLIGSSFNIL
ncbi:hypothetical protein RMQ97_01055 [Maricaulis sp. D1M11]|uniref:hypothetical protein n=1 Tax=Maricaulis sp. D1M11 TaxID=3076117 RepID=UPI0039B49E17